MKKVLFFVFLSLFGIFSNESAVTAKEREKEIKVITYNIHHCNPPAEQGKIDVDAIAKVISESGAHFALLQEVDMGTVRSSGINQAKELAAKSGLRYFEFYKAIEFSGGEYGIAILSRFPADSVKSAMLYSEKGGEQRVMGLFYTTLPGFGGVCVAATHLDLPHKIRSIQVIQADSLLRTQNLPVIFGGDLNAKPDSPELKILFDNFQTIPPPMPFTFPNTDPDRTIDYLFTNSNSGFIIKNYKVTEGVNSSDHLPLVITLRYSF